MWLAAVPVPAPRSARRSPKNPVFSQKKTAIFRKTLSAVSDYITKSVTPEGPPRPRPQTGIPVKERSYMNRILSAFAVVLSALPLASAQVATPSFRMASGPALIAPGEHLLLCAGNLRSQAITVTLEILQAVTGTVVAGMSVTLPPITGPTPVALPGDPCIEFSSSITSAPSSASPAALPAAPGLPLYIGLVSVSSESAPPSTACLNGNHFIGNLVASLQAFTPAASASSTEIPIAIRYIPVIPSDPCIPIGPILVTGA